MNSMKTDSSIKREITKMDGHEIKQVTDFLVNERPLTLFLNGQEWITLLTSMGAETYLAIGFLYSEGIIRQYDDLKSVEIDLESGQVDVTTKKNVDLQAKLKGKRTLTTGCGKGTVFYDVLDSLTSKPVNDEFLVEASSILQRSKEFNQQSLLFRETGGVHGCALCDENSIVLFHEDIGRHNALDKIIGHALSDGISMKGKWVLTTGRLSSEIVIKAGNHQIGMLVSRSAATDLAVDLAQQLNMTLIGFARGNRMNIYSGSQRVFIPPKE
ncbi:MAG: formate dehydrogenase accessory sulfurtransferase FdhD [Bacillota bacterium]|nr:formate dehydrogenase accessory sulfurtransferase FdhD [Bacillota bacterium]